VRSRILSGMVCFSKFSFGARSQVLFEFMYRGVLRRIASWQQQMEISAMVGVRVDLLVRAALLASSAACVGRGACTGCLSACLRSSSDSNPDTQKDSFRYEPCSAHWAAEESDARIDLRSSRC